MSFKVAVFILLFVSTGFAEDHVAKPIDCSQLLTWMVAGIPSQRLSRLVHERGIKLQVGQNAAEFLENIGAANDLLSEMRKPGAFPNGAQNDDCPADLLNAAELVHRHRYADGETIVKRLLVADPENADLHLALGSLRMQQGDVDEGFDDYADAKDLDPTFPEIHNGLSEVFYRSNDGENAIAEARTALSIDPQNAEGYRYLGLGLYANENYPAALHAFQESLKRDPNQADTYYDLGLVQMTDKKLSAAAESFRNAIRLNPELSQARTKLNLVLHELGPTRAAVDETKPKSDRGTRQ
ncbi:MAG TPA: tetratricopeptide repeat protein [Terriglobales bacterium]|nr:tetratricopeptide repeat protein [Terriglobales bacterium]